MKALTLWQPWASLIVDGRKPIETRPRPWHHVGPVAIHAGLHVDHEACIRFGYNPDTIPTGAVLGTAFKSGLLQFPDRFVAPDPYGDYAPGRWGYFFERIQKFKEPVPARGHQGFWDWENK
jgi:hypothetical protein